MPGKYDLSSQELFIMEILWSNASPSSEWTLGEITELLQAHGFQPTIGTAKTYLTRLVKKGALDTHKVGHKLLYRPSCTEQDYEQKWTNQFLHEHFHGSVAAFLSALTGARELPDDQLQELKDYFHE